MKNPISKLLLFFGMVITIFSVVDFMTYQVTGRSLSDLIGGGQPPLLGAIANQLAGVPMWLFLLIVAVAVAVLSSLIALVLVSSYRRELSQ